MSIGEQAARYRHAARYVTVAVLMLISGLCTTARAEMIDGIVAVVDDTVIMYSDVLKKMDELGAKDRDRSTTRQVLQIMVEDAVVEKVYRRMGLQPVDIRHAEQAARDMNMDVGSARMMIMKSTLMDLMVKSRVVITDAMVREYYEKNGDYKGAESVHLKQILVRQDMDKARRASDLIRSGKGFDEVAAEYSELLLAGSPDIGWVPLSHLAQEVYREVESAKPGETVGPVRVGDSILIFEVVERGTSGGRPLDDVRDEIAASLQEKYRKEAFEHWLNMIMAEHYIGIYL